MPPDPPPTLWDYFKSLKSLWGVLVGAATLSPFLSKLLPESLSSYVFPPLGNAEAPARIGAFIFALATIFLAFFWRATLTRNNPRRVVISTLLSMALYCSYLLAYSRFVRTVQIPTRQAAVSVSVGYHRTEFAIRTFGGDSDWELLRQRGTEEEEIWKLWTASSILVARGTLWLTYVGSILCLIFGLSWGALYQAEGKRRAVKG